MTISINEQSFACFAKKYLSSEQPNFISRAHLDTIQTKAALAEQYGSAPINDQSLGRPSTSWYYTGNKATLSIGSNETKYVSYPYNFNLNLEVWSVQIDPHSQNLSGESGRLSGAGDGEDGEDGEDPNHNRKRKLPTGGHYLYYSDDGEFDSLFESKKQKVKYPSKLTELSEIARLALRESDPRYKMGTRIVRPAAPVPASEYWGAPPTATEGSAIAPIMEHPCVEIQDQPIQSSYPQGKGKDKGKGKAIDNSNTSSINIRSREEIEEDIAEKSSELNQVLKSLGRDRPGESSRVGELQGRILEMQYNLENLEAELNSLDNGADNIQVEACNSFQPSASEATLVEPILSPIAPSSNEVMLAPTPPNDS